MRWRRRQLSRSVAGESGWLAARPGGPVRGRMGARIVEWRAIRRSALPSSPGRGLPAERRAIRIRPPRYETVADGAIAYSRDARATSTGLDDPDGVERLDRKSGGEGKAW